MGDRQQMYESFASVYDAFMDNVPYGQWGDHLVSRLRAEGIQGGLVLDLGCGTGSMTEQLSRAGYDMIGVDASLDMLEIARQKQAASGCDILYLLQDMREFELYGTVRAVVSVCDSLNYIRTEEELRRVFRLVNNYLDPGGLFLFDMNSLYEYRENLGDNTFAENREECSFIWENSWYEEEKLNEYDLTLFFREESGLYRRCSEVHCQRAYEQETVVRLLEEAGLRSEGVFDGYSGQMAHSMSERLLFAAREQGK